MAARDVAAANRAAGTLDRLAAATDRALIAAWSALGSYDVEDSLLWHATARPIVLGSADAAADVMVTYAEATYGVSAPVSPLLIADAGARTFDPFDRIAALVANGHTQLEAQAAARPVVSALGRTTVYRTGRQATAEQPIAASSWVRKLNPGACDWCMAMSREEWPSAADAAFGHDNCGCVPVPADAIGDENVKARKAAGFDEAAERRYTHRSQMTQLRRSERTARKRQAQARADQLTETDPARLERLSIREQEWETRAERAAERLRILATGSHRLAA